MFFATFIYNGTLLRIRDETVHFNTWKTKIILLHACFFLFLGFLSNWGQDSDISVEKLLNNLKTGKFSGMPIDLDLKNAGLVTFLSQLEKSVGLTFELSPRIMPESLGERDYNFKQVRWDRILSLVLQEFRLEAIPGDGNVRIQPKEENLMKIVKEGQFRPAGRSFRVAPWVYALTFLLLAGATAGFLIYRKRSKTRKTSSGGFVLDPDKSDEIMKRVTYLLDVEKTFRKENLSLQTLSGELSIPPHQLSWVINKRMNVTFSELVNSYRMEDVKKRLSSSQEADKTILEIAFDSGFNTKTSFNRVFKKHTGLTPSQFRKRHRPD